MSSPSNSAVERGKRVVEERLRLSSQQAVLVATISQAKHSPTRWTGVAMNSEIQTLQCIMEAKDAEILLLKHQLVQTNKLIKECRDEIQRLSGQQGIASQRIHNTLVPRTQPVPQGPYCKLLESFSRASASNLNKVLGHIEKSLGATDVQHVPHAIDRARAVEMKYDQLYSAVCFLFNVKPEDTTHRDTLKQINALAQKAILTDAEIGLANEVKGKRGIAWTFHP